MNGIKKRFAALVVTMLVALVALAGCTRFDREGSIDEMMDDLGLTRPQAECFVDDMVDEFGEDRVISDDEPTPEEADKVLELLTACLEANPS